MSSSEASLKSLGLKYKNLFKSKEDFNIIFINNHNLKIIISSKTLEKILNLSSTTLENTISLINLSIYHQSEVKAFDEGNTKNFSEYIQTKPLFGININDRLRIMINKFSLEYILQLQNLDFEDLLSYISLDVVEEIENEYKEIINKSRTITEFNHKSLKNQSLENNKNDIGNKNINNNIINNNENNNNEMIINYNKDVKSKKFIKSKVFFKDFNPCLKNIGKILENIVKTKDKIREKANNYLNDKNNEISKVEPNFIRKVYLKKVINVIKKKNRIKVFDIHGNQVIINKRDIENYDENKIYILIKDMNNNNIVVSLEDLKNKINDWGLLEKKIDLKNEENNNNIEIQIKDLDFPKIFMENMEKHYQMNEEFELEKNKKDNNEIEEDNNEIKEDNKEIKDNNNEIKEDNKEIKEDKKEIKEDNKEIKDNNNEIKEDNKEIKDNNNEIKDNNNEIKDNNNEIKEDKEDNIEIKEDNNEIKEDKEDNIEIKEDNNEIKEDNIEIKEDNKEEKNEKEEDNNKSKNLLDKNTENNEEEEEIILNENDNNQEENFEINTKNEKEITNNNNINSHLYKLNSIQENENEDEDNENENNNNPFDTPIEYGNEDKNKNIIIDEIPIEDHNIIDDGKYNEEPKSSNDYVTLTSLIKNNDNNKKLKHHPNNKSFDQSSNIKSENIAKKNSYHRRLVSTPNPLFKMNLNFETSLKMKSGQIGRPLKIRREIYRSFS